MIAVLALNLAITIAALALVERQPRRPDRNGVGQFADAYDRPFGDVAHLPPPHVTPHHFGLTHVSPDNLRLTVGAAK